MDALELIRRDHEQVKQLLDEATHADRPEQREQLLARIRAELAAHERMEEQVFYPTLERHDAATIVREAREEHHVADIILDELMEVPSDSDVWSAKMKVLKESVEHHIAEEEREMFQKARQALGGQLDDLGRRMSAVKNGAGE